MKSFAIAQLLALLEKRPGLSCTEIGETLWSKGHCDRQGFARPAGKLVKRAIELGLVREQLTPRRIFFLKEQPDHD